MAITRLAGILVEAELEGERYVIVALHGTPWGDAIQSNHERLFLDPTTEVLARPGPAGEHPLVSSFSARLVRTVPLAPARVWEGWSRPEVFSRWFLGEWGESGAIDFAPGGTFRVDGRTPDGARIAVTGTIDDVVEGESVRGTFQWHGAPGDPETQVEEAGPTRFEFLVRPAGSGSEIEVVHGGLASEASAAGYRAGWESAIARLDALAAPPR